MSGNSLTNTQGHTPGPWIIAGKDFVYALNEDGHNRMWFKVDGGHVSGLERTSQGEVAATARLIAAAPDLLDACEQALMQAEADETMHGRKFGWGNALREAIAKATGAA